MSLLENVHLTYILSAGLSVCEETAHSRAPLASRRSQDVYRFMTNMFVYQMRQRKPTKSFTAKIFKLKTVLLYRAVILIEGRRFVRLQ